MRTLLSKHVKDEEGSVLFTALVFGVMIGLGCLSLVSFSANRVLASHQRWDSTEAFYHAENALGWGARMIADKSGSPAGKYSIGNGSLALGYMANLGGSATVFKDAWVTVDPHPGGQANSYVVTASAKVGTRVRTVQATIRKNPPSEVFDYEYFLNNWGWWWGSSITGDGDNRANGDFDFRHNPTVNGTVIANGIVASAGTRINPLNGNPPIRGLAGDDPVSYIHDGAARLEMPNLKNFDYYTAQATANAGSVTVGGVTVLSAIHTNTTKPGLYLKGTAAAPIKINGPVVIPGDLIISGPVSGIGTFYVGGNLYVAGDITYANGPDFSWSPETKPDPTRDSWVKSAVDAKKDLVCFAVRESILGGQVNGSAWKGACFDTAPYGMKYVGAEANLGADGIPGTADDGINYFNTSGSGAPNSAWYDADGDGAIDTAYNYSKDVEMTVTRAQKIQGYPLTGSDAPKNYNDLSSNDFNTLEGIFYCNHAAAMRASKANFRLNGSLICRDEAVIFSTSAKFVYDSRIHSRYSDDPNRHIDLGLPIAGKCALSSFTELVPKEGFYAAAQ